MSGYERTTGEGGASGASRTGATDGPRGPQPGRAAPARLVLFDIDGTLLMSDGAGRQAMQRAGRALYGPGFELDGVEFAGKLDRNIWREVCALNRIDDGPDEHARFRGTYVRLLDELLQSGAGGVRAMAGMRALLERLWARTDVLTGILSGNYPESGALKVAAAGLPVERFPVGAWGSDADRRVDLLPVALDRCEDALGWRPEARGVVVVGDTPADVAVAREHGARCLAVLTGWSERAELEAAGADWVVQDVTDTDAVVAWMLAGAPAAGQEP